MDLKRAGPRNAMNSFSWPRNLVVLGNKKNAFSILSTVQGEKQTRKLEAQDKYVKQTRNSGNCKDKEK